MITEKRYRCIECGYENKQSTNHFGETYSSGKTNTCPECPPWRKYPEYSGLTIWLCLDSFVDQKEAKRVYKQCKKQAGCGPWSDQLHKVLTEPQIMWVNARWNERPGYTSFADTFLEIMNGRIQ